MTVKSSGHISTCIRCTDRRASGTGAANSVIVVMTGKLYKAYKALTGSGRKTP